MDEKQKVLMSERARRENEVKTKWDLLLADAEQQEMVLKRDLKALEITQEAESP